MHDFLLTNHGSVVTLSPLTAAAHEWVNENLPRDTFAWGKSIPIEARYAGDIITGIDHAGLTIKE